MSRCQERSPDPCPRLRLPSACLPARESDRVHGQAWGRGWWSLGTKGLCSGGFGVQPLLRGSDSWVPLV